MAPGFITYLLSYLSGVLSTLSPCVLPLLPIVLGSAVTASRFGPLALTTGVMLSFGALGLFFATAGTTLGFSEDALRDAAAALLVIAGVALMMPAVQHRLAIAASGVSNAGHTFLGRLKLGGSGGQFVIGLVLGAVWSPCIGPTLGGAIALASQSRDLARVAALMGIYALGAGTPMILLGSVPRIVAARLRGNLLSIGQAGKYVLGGSLCVLGILTLSGFDKTLETMAIDHSPAWLTNLTTRI